MSTDKVFEDYTQDEIVSFQLGEYIIDIPKELKDEILISNYHFDCAENQSLNIQSNQAPEATVNPKAKGHYAMENFIRVTEEEQDQKLSDPEQELDKLLSLEINNIDLINENLKLKQLLKRAKVGMWKEFQNLQEETEQIKNKQNELETENGKK
jgi:hypothetical protein